MLEIFGLGLTICVAGMPANGSSRCSEATLKFSMRTAAVPSRKYCLPVLSMIVEGHGVVTQTIPVLTVASDAKLAPATNDTSAFCAWQKVVVVKIAERRTMNRLKNRSSKGDGYGRASQEQSGLVPYRLYRESPLMQKARCPAALVT